MKSIYEWNSFVFNLCCSVYEGMNVHNKLRLNGVLTACSLLYLTTQYSFTHSHSSHSICFIFYSVMDKTLQSVSTPYVGPKGR